jgi:hypothetical protein
MLRKLSFPPLLVLSLFLQANTVLAQNTPSSAPPRLERIEEGSDTPITVTPPKGANRKITEKKENGRVTEVKVQSGKSTYYMKPNVPAGNAQPGDGQSSAIRAPTWKVMEFDLGKKKPKDKDEDPADTKPAPAPPAAK